MRELSAFLTIMKQTDFPVDLHGDDYFDQVEEWLEQLEIGNQLPRDSRKVKESLIDIVVDNPTFVNFKNQEQLQMIYIELRTVRERGTTENE